MATPLIPTNPDDTSEYYGQEFCEAHQLADEVEYMDVDMEKCSPEIKLQIAQVPATLAVAAAIEPFDIRLASRN